MAHTNQTPHFDLPQFLGTDKASWLGDINPAMLAIDTALFQIQTDASDAASSSAAAQQSAQAAETAAELAQSQSEENTTQIAALKTTVDSQQVQLGTLSAGQTSQGASITQLQTDVQTAQNDATQAQQLANAAQQTATQNSGTLTLPTGILSTGAGQSAGTLVVPSSQGYQLIAPFRAHIRYDAGDTSYSMQIYIPSLNAQLKHLFMVIYNVIGDYSADSPTLVNPYLFKQIFGNYTDLSKIATFTLGQTTSSGALVITVKNLLPKYQGKPYMIFGTLVGTNQPFSFRDYNTGSQVSDPYPAGSVITV